MKNYKRKKLNFIQYRLFVLITLLWASLFLTACGKKTPPKPPPAPLTLEQIRQSYIKRLSDNGAQVIKVGQTIRVVLLSDYLFNPRSANIQNDYRPVLRTLARLMNTYVKVNVKVAGYTNTGHNLKHEQALTTRQAQVVAKYLWLQGIDARLQYAVGRNQQNPVAWNGNVLGRHLNRRIEVSFQFYPKTVPYA